MYEHYDIKGRVRRLEQRKQWGFTEGPLSQIQNFESYDVEFSPAGLVLAKICYTHGGAVHRSTRFERDGLGRPVRSEEFDSKGEKTKISELVYSQGKCTWITRAATGVAVSQGVDQYAGSHLVLSSSYDAKGNPKTLKSFEYEEGKVSRSVSKYCGLDGTVYAQWITTYDAAGRLAKTFGLKGDGSPLGDGKYSYEYGEDGRQTKVWTFNDWENIATSVRVSEYRNDTAGNWLERHDFHRSKDDSAWRRQVTTRLLSYYSLD